MNLFHNEVLVPLKLDLRYLPANEQVYGRAGFRMHKASSCDFYSLFIMQYLASFCLHELDNEGAVFYIPILSSLWHR